MFTQSITNVDVVCDVSGKAFCGGHVCLWPSISQEVDEYVFLSI
jgi:hypothetical protein